MAMGQLLVHRMALALLVGQPLSQLVVLVVLLALLPRVSSPPPHQLVQHLASSSSSNLTSLVLEALHHHHPFLLSFMHLPHRILTHRILSLSHLLHLLRFVLPSLPHSVTVKSSAPSTACMCPTQSSPPAPSVISGCHAGAK